MHTFQALKQLPREKIQVATKFGFVSGITVRGDPEYVRASCEASLQRLGVDYIDLYYQHRVDTSIPIEETVSNFSPFFNRITSFAIFCKTSWRR